MPRSGVYIGMTIKAMPSYLTCSTKLHVVFVIKNWDHVFEWDSLKWRFGSGFNQQSTMRSGSVFELSTAASLIKHHCIVLQEDINPQLRLSMCIVYCLSISCGQVTGLWTSGHCIDTMASQTSNTSEAIHQQELFTACGGLSIEDILLLALAYFWNQVKLHLHIVCPWKHIMIWIHINTLTISGLSHCMHGWVWV